MIDSHDDCCIHLHWSLDNDLFQPSNMRYHRYNLDMDSVWNLMMVTPHMIAMMYTSRNYYHHQITIKHTLVNRCCEWYVLPGLCGTWATFIIGRTFFGHTIGRHITKRILRLETEWLTRCGWWTCLTTWCWCTNTCRCCGTPATTISGTWLTITITWT